MNFMGWRGGSTTMGLWIALGVMAWSAPVAAATPHSVPQNIMVDTKVAGEAKAALARGMAWLESQQAADGRLGSPRYPAVTALALTALKAGGTTNAAVVAKATQFVRAFLIAKTGGSANNDQVAVCRMALGELPREAQAHDAVSERDRKIAAVYRDLDIRTRDYELRQLQWRQQRAALSQAGGGDPDRLLAAQVAKSVMASMKGGPAPAAAAAAYVEPPQYAKRGYGNMSYAGLLRLAYDEVAADDPRVDALLDWAGRAWALDANPGKGQNGLYYFYQALAKCLNASGEEEIKPLKGGKSIRWRDEMLRKLVALQKAERNGQGGYWVNPTGSWLEHDPVLVTAYALLTLERALGMIR